MDIHRTQLILSKQMGRRSLRMVPIMRKLSILQDMNLLGLVLETLLFYNMMFTGKNMRIILPTSGLNLIEL
jgi:hypothetical protein